MKMKKTACLVVGLPVILAAAALGGVPSPGAEAGGLYVRFKLIEPRETEYFVRLEGFIHNSPWRLPRAIVPAGADNQAPKRIASGEFTSLDSHVSFLT